MGSKVPSHIRALPCRVTNLCCKLAPWPPSNPSTHEMRFLWIEAGEEVRSFAAAVAALKLKLVRRTLSTIMRGQIYSEEVRPNGEDVRSGTVEERRRVVVVIVEGCNMEED
ncbi:hypothetical protein GYH30_002274 [Glycine max]|uniref:Uncharacterized protein n=2 Tax=Glycine subgen. Soja TaxID=1462606 RepID=K7K509_SOYBN|nr:hypothetical protein GYH30_002274 [Glycine max]RZC31068.1 hypothetical protein D0Y65_002186 [Glycine soja]